MIRNRLTALLSSIFPEFKVKNEAIERKPNRPRWYKRIEPHVYWARRFLQKHFVPLVTIALVIEVLIVIQIQIANGSINPLLFL